MIKLKDTPILTVAIAVIFLVIGAALGGMFIKIQTLEGKVAGTDIAANPTPTQPTNPTQPAAPAKVDVKVNDTDPVKGSPNAKLTVVEFADYQCPYCAKYHSDVLIPMIKEYVDTGKVKFVFKNLAFLGTESVNAANAALCAKEQNKFWEYHEKLFASQSGENQGGFAADKLKGFASDLGLNTSQFNDCLDKQKYNAQVTADNTEANRNGFQSTPSTAVGSTAIIGAQPYAQFKAAIDAALAK